MPESGFWREVIRTIVHVSLGKPHVKTRTSGKNVMQSGGPVLEASRVFPIAEARGQERPLSASRGRCDETTGSCRILRMQQHQPGAAQERTIPLWSLLLGLAVVVLLTGYCLS